MVLQIKHTGNVSAKGKPLFKVVRLPDGKDTDPVALTPPREVQVGAHNINLAQGLKWYLEDYLQMPVGAYNTQADDVQAALKQWGRSCFDALFASGRARDWYHDARQRDLAGLRIKIASDDAAVLSWPWEALYSGDDGFLAQQCQMERQLAEIGGTRPLPDSIQGGQINVLYIIARPSGDGYVGFQTLSRPLIDLVNSGGWPVHIYVLRPPTFDRLMEVLEKQPGFYHIVHFDGHGGFGGAAAQSYSIDARASKDKFAASEGTLAFEKDDIEHSKDSISAETLGELLRRYNIPVMVLNACKSAMLGEGAADPSATVAVSLLKAGVRSVLAMSYSLYVKGAEAFVPDFYQRLFRKGDIADAAQAGRRKMRRENMRDTFIGQVEFNDWVVPVLYQQEAEDILPVIAPGSKRESVLPDEARDIGSYGFIGRERAIQQLERAVLRKPAGILIHGMAGEGKTTLVKGFLQWLEATNGLGNGVFWFNFEEIHSAGYIIDVLSNGLFGLRAVVLSNEQKIAAITKKLTDNKYYIVWDNFESATGIPGTEVSAMLNANDLAILKKFLNSLRGGKTKVLITSRYNEDNKDDEDDKKLFKTQNCFRLPLGGLEGEELWQYCNAVVADLGFEINRKEKAYRELIDKLDGNPLSIRTVLSQLQNIPVSKILADFDKIISNLDGDDKSSQRMQAAITLLERGMDRSFAPVLQFLGLHEHYIDLDLLEIMLKKLNATNTHVNNCFAVLEKSGLCRPYTKNGYLIHPTLHGTLSRLHPADENVRRVFVDIMSSLANLCAGKELYELQDIFKFYKANFYKALDFANELDMQDDIFCLTQSFANYAYKNRNYDEAEQMYKTMAQMAVNQDNSSAEAAAYHQMGIVAQERRDLDAAERWYKESLKIELKQNNEHGSALTYHQLGMVAQERRDFDAAERWYKKSLEIELKQNDEHGSALTYHQLGMVAQERRDLDAAEGWYKKSLEIELKLNDEYGAASTYHQLGNVAYLSRDFDAAEDWYKKSLEIKLKQNDEHGAALIYHQLGMVAQERRDFNAAEGWYKKSLEIELKQNDGYGATSTYHQLGNVAYLSRDFDAAEDWYLKSLEIKLKQNNEHGAATTYHQLGIVAQERQDFDAAERWYKKSLEIKLKLNDEHGAATTYHQLGRVAQKCRDFDAAESLYNQALEIFIEYNDNFYTDLAKRSLARLDELRKILEMYNTKQALINFARHDPDFAAYATSLPSEVFTLDKQLPDGFVDDVVELLRAEQPEFSDLFNNQQNDLPPEKFGVDPLAAAGMLAAILFLLRSHIKIEGKHFVFEYKPMGNAMLEKVLNTLSSILKK